MSSEDFIYKLNEMIYDQKYITFQTDTIEIKFNCFAPSINRFITTKLEFKFNNAGSVEPRIIKVISFPLDMRT